MCLPEASGLSVERMVSVGDLLVSVIVSGLELALFETVLLFTELELDADSVKPGWPVYTE